MCQIIMIFNTEKPCTVPLLSPYIKTEGLWLNITIYIYIYFFFFCIIFYLRHSRFECLVSYKYLFLTITFGTDNFKYILCHAKHI